MLILVESVMHHHALEPNPPAVLVYAKISITIPATVVHVIERVLAKHQPAAQALVQISPLIPGTVVPAMRSPVLDCRLAVVQANVLILRPRLLIAAPVAIRAQQTNQPAAPEHAPTSSQTPTIVADARSNALAPLQPAVTGYVQILARISRTVEVARRPLAWAPNQRVALVSVQIWRPILTTVDLARRVLVLVLTQLAARGHV
ncbi:uncharacterized protein N7500_010851 [Penicillium coprophilum]|uniref:uncharacterized protein n=1 Tax=Penicillium coprophilum TaxID=36646 RepID=UPI00239EFD76|nr:uncharacterized protein N7500_010851 [Penicillium coprophilum]KAJ5150662.1 hypothetical protein N7500_010851 [Penicillium coprophilum]